MKKLFTIILLYVLLHSNKAAGQIALDTIIYPQYSILYDSFKIVQISPTESKYIYCDTVSNTFTLYNMDFTPFVSNISVPEPFIQNTPPPTTFRVLYVTRTLFDCDSSNIEYVYEAATNPKKPFYIMRTDGTQLFKLDSANGPYCFGDCLGGSGWLKPIANSSSGAKLFLQRGNVPGIYVYSLCGYLPTELIDFTAINQSFVKVFPNPTSKFVTFEITTPDNINAYDLVIYRSNSSEIIRKKMDMGVNQYVIDVSNLSGGSYYYSLCTQSKAYQVGKFVLTK